MTAASQIRILTVDDHPVLREGIAAILATESDMVLVAEACNGREAIEQFRTHLPDITLMDLQMPLGGGEAILAIRKEFPNTKGNQGRMELSAPCAVLRIPPDC